MILKKKPFWLSIFLGAILVSPALWFMLDSDQGFKSYNTWVWLNYGEMPTIVAFPGIYFFYAMSFKLFGFSMFSVRLMDYFIQILNIVLIFYLAYKASGSELSGLLAVMLYSVYYISRAGSIGGEADGMALPFLLFASFFYIVLKERTITISIILVGLTIGKAFLMKPTYGLSGLIFFLFYLYHLRRKKASISEILKYETILTSFSLLVSLVTILLYYRAGQLDELYQGVWLLDREVYVKLGVSGSSGYFSGWVSILYGIFHSHFEIWFGVLLFVLEHLRRNERGSVYESELLLSSIFIICFLSVIFQGKGLWYHKAPLLGFGCILAGIGYSGLIEFATSTFKRPKIAKFIFSSIFIFLLLASLDLNLLVFIKNNCYRSLEVAYKTQDSARGVKYLEVANYIKQRTTSEDLVLGWGYLYTINFLAQRRAPVRHFDFDHILLLEHLWTGKTDNFHPMIVRWQADFVNRLKAKPPIYFIIWESPKRSFKATLKLIPGLDDFFVENYELEKTIDEIQIYRLKQS